jgi:hypothetical protein
MPYLAAHGQTPDNRWQTPEQKLRLGFPLASFDDPLCGFLNDAIQAALPCGPLFFNRRKKEWARLNFLSAELKRRGVLGVGRDFGALAFNVSADAARQPARIGCRCFTWCRCAVSSVRACLFVRHARLGAALNALDRVRAHILRRALNNRHQLTVSIDSELSQSPLQFSRAGKSCGPHVATP